MIYHKAVNNKDPKFPGFAASTSLDGREPDSLGSKVLNLGADVDRKLVTVLVTEHTNKGWVDMRYQLNTEQGQALYDFLTSVFGPN